MGGVLILIRHGQSEWNQKNIFTGFVDVRLSEQGRMEALRAKESLKSYSFDAVFCSALIRAQETARIILEGRVPKEYYCNQALNERHYGDLQGQNKDEIREKYGAEQVQIWRRSFDVRPPNGESLKDTCARVIPYYLKEIEPRVRAGKTVLVSAHGNSLRALIKHLEKISDENIVKLEIATGVPIIYHLDDNGAVVNKVIVKP
ncbi:MAG: 2,3-bisphosphoglycerate-dependent phosphoglycerate mutase [Myxococcales bacterium]|nr:2,3-bisphosphoglycerate-dependent phosphoglycerate mutase [Myxococcales bacterium]USN50007.1 MAG: 2,3-bisphosphoglycerate-dependent phosphoglycerate mutase [Myxococcales bacterium]